MTVTSEAAVETSAWGRRAATAVALAAGEVPRHRPRRDALALDREPLPIRAR